MTEIGLVRASRDGDQFHYWWAARRSLALLSPVSGLRRLTIEGPAPEDAAGAAAGDEVIDVAEYFAGDDAAGATRQCYFQLKHSTLQASTPWTASGLETTLAGFGARYRRQATQWDEAALLARVEFHFVTNRPIDAAVVSAIADPADPAHATTVKLLRRYSGLNVAEFRRFCRLLRLEGNQENYLAQRATLHREIGKYLPGSDVEAPIALKELVTRKATSEFTTNPSITRLDLLRALGTGEDELLPAPSRISLPAQVVPREAEPVWIATIRGANGPVLVEADGGVGKSVFAVRLREMLGAGDAAVLYDCFGNGEYRNLSHPRHRAQEGLVQIANELAGAGLCDPLIPASRADRAQYARAFIYRLEQTMAALRARRPDARLFIIIDAADNAEMEAASVGDGHSFGRALLRQALPVGVQLVLLCRPYRAHHLDPPPQTVRLELSPFSRGETAAMLRAKFPEATEREVDEFHQRTSQNPRVQATALAAETTLADVLRALGPTPKGVTDTINDLLDRALATVRDHAGADRTQVDRMCIALATLRPLLPIKVVAMVAGVSEAAVRSFANDFQQPLLRIGDHLQFRDEPTETWFHERFRPQAGALAAFVRELKPHADRNPYIAAVLPGLLLQAGEFQELVDLALSSQALPNASSVERRDIELQRLQFALRAALKQRRYLDAIKLAQKAGSEAAAGTRQRKLLLDNPDIAARFLEPERLLEMVSRREFGSAGGWLGGHYVYEASLLAGHASLAGEASSRLRMAYEWLRHWLELPDEQRERERFEADDLAELMWAELELHGPQTCAEQLARWRPESLSYRAGLILTRRLVDQGRFGDVDQLAEAATDNLFLVLAIAEELWRVFRLPPTLVLTRSLGQAVERECPIKDPQTDNSQENLVAAITSLIGASCQAQVGDCEAMAALLSRYLPAEPPHGLASPHPLNRPVWLRAYALRAALLGKPVDLADVARPDIRDLLTKEKSSGESQELREFRETMSRLLPWYRLWAEAVLAPRGLDLEEAIPRTLSEAGRTDRFTSMESSELDRESAQCWFSVLILTGASEDALNRFQSWRTQLKHPLYTNTLDWMIRVCAATQQFPRHALACAAQSLNLTRGDRTHAESMVDDLVRLARAVLPISLAEAQAHFNEAIGIASNIGEEHVVRWNGLLDLAEAAGTLATPDAELAYRFARAGEVIYGYMARDKYFDWGRAVRVLVNLSPASSLAILSRWRDRHFGHQPDLLPEVVDQLLKQRQLDPIAAIALVGFRADWDLAPLLHGALTACTSASQRTRLVNVVQRYALLGASRLRSWQDIDAVVQRHNVSPPGIASLIAQLEAQERLAIQASREDVRDIRADSEKPPLDWEAVFQDLDLTRSVALSEAYRRFRDAPNTFRSDGFFAQAMQRVRAGTEALFLGAVGSVPDFSYFETRDLLKVIPSTWTSLGSVQEALRQLIKTLLRRHCLSVSINPRASFLPLDVAEQATGISRAGLAAETLDAIAEIDVALDAEELFNVAGLVAAQLSPLEAIDGLSFGLQLLERQFVDADGDGPWSPVLAPPPTVAKALAGYIWAGLAHPEASDRWEAAHVMRTLCLLERTEVVDAVIALAKDIAANGAFADAQLRFYRMHARLWLVIALARAALESPKVVTRYATFLADLALRGDPHVILRQFARAALDALQRAGYTLDPQDVASLRKVNTPRLAPRRYKPRARPPGEHPALAREQPKRFVFGYDMGRYWFESLADRFGMSIGELETEAEQVICDHWGLEDNGHWERDVRAKRKYFDRRSWHSHYTYPRVDDLSFYLSYHALMVVAGRLLETRAPVRDRSDNETFAEWLERHVLTRSDGRWLADRRDPPPLGRFFATDGTRKEGWRWQVSSADLDAQIGLEGDEMLLHGSWSMLGSEGSQSVDVSSALVSRSRSGALLRALQTCVDPMRSFLPDADREGEVDYPGFQLQGWVVDEHRSHGIDEYDPWSGSIRYPPLAPSDAVQRRLRLQADEERRTWVGPNGVALRCAIWGLFESGDEREEDQRLGSEGRVLLGSRQFIADLLRGTDRDLIVCIRLHRHLRERSWVRSKEGGPDYEPPYRKYYLVHADGQVTTLR